MATLIYNVTDLHNIRNDLAGEYELANDIDAAATANWNPTVDRGSWLGGTLYYVNDYVLRSGIRYICGYTHTSGSIWTGHYWWRVYDSSVPVYLGFWPLGTEGPAGVAPHFTGILDGKGYSIEGLYIDRPIGGYDGIYGQGLFYIARGTVKNVNLVNCDISGPRTQVSGPGWKPGAGSMAGLNLGLIQNCISSGVVTGAGAGGFVAMQEGTIEDCGTSCTVASPNGYAGGFFCYHGDSNHGQSGTTRRCYATGSVTAIKGSATYGIAGGFGYRFSKGSISFNYCTGSVEATDYASGFLDYINNVRPIDNCYSRSTTKAISGSGNVSGFVRAIYKAATGIDIYDCYATGFCDHTNKKGFFTTLTGTKPVQITDCFWDADTTTASTSNGGTGKTTAEMKHIHTFTDTSTVGLETPWDFETIWWIDNFGWINDGYPYFWLREAPPIPFLGGPVTGLFVRGGEIQAIFRHKAYRSPDFGENWYESEDLPNTIYSIGFDVNNYQNSLVGNDNQLHVFDQEISEVYHYTNGDAVSGWAISVDCDLNSNVTVVGTDLALYKTLKYGKDNSTRLWLPESITDVAIGGSYVTNPYYSFTPSTDGTLYNGAPVPPGSYSDVWSSATAYGITHEDSSMVGQRKQTIIGITTYRVDRFGLVFNTLTLPDKPILSAFIRFYIADISADEAFNIVVQGSNDYPSTPLVEGDYDKSHYSGNGGQVASSLLEVNRPTQLDLNSTGRGWINAGGHTRFILRTNRDIAGTEPSGNEWAKIYQTEKGSYYVPKLFVTLQTE